MKYILLAKLNGKFPRQMVNSVTFIRRVAQLLFSYLIWSLAPRDGGWSSWQPIKWSYAICCNGLMTRKRNCDNPSPAHGGAECDKSDEGPTATRNCPECTRGLAGCQHNCIEHDPRTSNLYFECTCSYGYSLSEADSRSCNSECVHFSWVRSSLSSSHESFNCKSFQNNCFAPKRA